MANWPALGSMVLPNVGGWVNGLYFAGQIRKDDGQKAWYDGLKKPSWNPPKWVFGPAWTVLYSSMGYASYIIYEECGGFQGMNIFFYLTLISLRLASNQFITIIIATTIYTYWFIRYYLTEWSVYLFSRVDDSNYYHCKGQWTNLWPFAKYLVFLAEFRDY